MAYPSTISALTSPNATDRLNAPSHSAIEQAQNTNITAIETFLGVEGPSSTAGTLIYDVRSPGSPGGGHVQTAITGGTGQTAYTKGDILAAQSASVLSKLAVGTDGQILQANSSVATGVNWVNSNTNKVANSATVSILSGAAVIGVETSIFSVSIPGSVLGSSGALRARVFVNEFLYPNGSVLLKANYGNNTVASVMVKADSWAGNSGQERRGSIEINLVNSAVTTQTGNIAVNAAIPNSSFVSQTQPGTSSINSAAANTLGLTILLSTGGNNTTFNTNGYTIEKIV